MKPQYLSLWKVLNSRHFQDDFINNFNSAIETAETKLMRNISELKYDIAEFKRNTDNEMVGETEFLRAELTAEKKSYRKLVIVTINVAWWTSLLL